MLLLLRLDLLPLHEHFVGSPELPRAKNMWMAPHELLVHLARDVLQRESSRLRRELRVKHHLDQNIAQLLAHVR